MSNPQEGALAIAEASKSAGPKEEQVRYNFITTNPLAAAVFVVPNGSVMLGIFKLEYERRLVKHLSLALMGVYVINTGSISDSYNGVSFTNSGTYTEKGGGLGLRYYFSSTETPQGLWLGLVGLYRKGSLEMEGHPDFYGRTTFKTEDIAKTEGGIELGYKWVFADWLTVSPYINANYLKEDFMGSVSTYISTNGGVNLGVAF